MDLSTLQSNVQQWVQHNFPDAEAYQQLLGVVEEIGELCHSHLKDEQGIRGTTVQHQLKAQDAIGDIIIYLAHYCCSMQYSLNDCIMMAWQEVSLRDWQKYPKNGLTE